MGFFGKLKNYINKFESKWVKWLYIIMMVGCVVILPLGATLAYELAKGYSSYRGFYIDWATFFAICVVTIFVAAFDAIIWNVICEHLNNVHIISKEVSKIAHRNEIREN